MGDGAALARLGGLESNALPQHVSHRRFLSASDPANEPGHVDVAIVGGGIIGLFAALRLSRRGFSVAVFEKGRLGGEQSTRCWGWCREVGRDMHEQPLAAKAMRMWRDASDSGAQLPFNASGIVYLARTDEQAERYTAYLDTHAPPADLARPLSKAELAELLPDLKQDWAFALHMPSDGRADPDLAVAQIASAAAQAGARIYTHCAVQGFETTAGRVSAIVTEHGRIACQSLIVAAGAWSSLFCRAHGVTLPMIKVVSSVLATEPLAAALKTSVFGDGFSFGRQRDGSYLVGHGGAAELPVGPDVIRFASHFIRGLRQEWGFVKSYVRPRFSGLAASDWRDMALQWMGGTGPYERRRVLNPPLAAESMSAALERLQRAFPIFDGARIKQRWAGVMDITPDALPVISAVPQHAGLVIGSGFSGHGFGLAPAAGEALADLATAGESDIDLTPFRLSRFFDGSRPLPGLRF